MLYVLHKTCRIIVLQLYCTCVSHLSCGWRYWLRYVINSCCSMVSCWRRGDLMLQQPVHLMQSAEFSSLELTLHLTTLSMTSCMNFSNYIGAFLFLSKIWVFRIKLQFVFKLYTWSTHKDTNRHFLGSSWASRFPLWFSVSSDAHPQQLCGAGQYSSVFITFFKHNSTRFSLAVPPLSVISPVSIILCHFA